MKVITLALSLLAVGMLVPATEAAAQKGDRYTITPADIAEKDGISNAYDAVRRIRSNWLRPPRPSGSIGATSTSGMAAGREPGVAIYIDDRRQDGVDDLKTVRVEDIAEIKYMSGTDGLARYGNGHEYGVIFVKTKSRTGG